MYPKHPHTRQLLNYLVVDGIQVNRAVVNSVTCGDFNSSADIGDIYYHVSNQQRALDWYYLALDQCVFKLENVSCQLETCLKDMADMKGMKEEASSLRNTMELLKQELQEAKDIEKKNSDDVNALMREIQILRTYINLDEKDQLESSMDKEDISQLKKALHEVINNWGSPSAKQTTSTSK